MLGAVLLSALALTGSSGPLWWSDLPPRAGQPYIGVSYTGPGTFACDGLIGRQVVRATAYELDDTTICVLHVPSGSAGKKLTVRYDIETREGQLVTVASGAVRPKLIRA